MLNNPKKPIYIKPYLPLVLLAIPLVTSALSVSEFIGYLKNATVTKKVNTIREENLQSLRVLEPNKVFAQTPDVAPENKTLIKEEDTSFEVKNDFIDDLDADPNENHSENAIYTVQKGDSIYSIASYFGVSVQTIMTFNHMNSKEVHAGDVLEVPSVSGVLYTVKKGDTLASLSKKYSIDPQDVTLYNGLFSGDTLAIGDEIFLPGAKEAEVPKKTTSSGKSGSSIKTTSSSKSPLASKAKTWAKGDTSHLNTVADINKYSALPKFSFIFPAPGAVRTQKMHGHNGVDLAGRMGTPILAAADGTVSVAKTGGYNFGYGNYIIVTHSNGSETVYAHMQRVDITPGQAVSAGQQIGTMGSTGNSTGPHVHFEVRGAYNPFAW